MNVATEFNEFKDTLFNKTVEAQNGTYKVNKISWSCFDDKRFVLYDGIHTLVYFHKDLKK